MPIGDFNPVNKPSHNRNKPKRKQRGEITANVRKQLYERSGGYCERCGVKSQLEGAHTLRRLDIKVKTTVEDLCHACVTCHDWMDETKEGKLFKQTFRKAAYIRAGREKEFYM